MLVIQVRKHSHAMTFNFEGSSTYWTLDGNEGPMIFLPTEAVSFNFLFLSLFLWALVSFLGSRSSERAWELSFPSLSTSAKSNELEVS